MSRPLGNIGPETMPPRPRALAPHLEEQVPEPDAVPQWALQEEQRAGRLLVLPLSVFLLVMLVLPLLTNLVFSFWRTEQYALIPDWTLANYARLLSSGSYLYFLGKSFLMASVVSLVCLIIGYPIAYYIAKEGGKYSVFLLLLIAAPFFMGTLLRILGLQGILGPLGVVNLTLLNIGLEPIEALMYSDLATLIGMVLMWIPFMVLAINVGLSHFNFRLLDAASACGAHPFRVFWEITRPLSWPGVASGLVLVFVPSFAEHAVPLFLGGPGGTLFGNSLWGQLEAGSWSLAAAMGTVILLVSGLVCLALLFTAWRVWKREG